VAIQIWDPIKDMRHMEDYMNRLWRTAPAYGAGSEDWNILIDVLQRQDELVVRASMPGIKPEDIDLSIEENVLTLRAERKTDADAQDTAYLIRERPAGSFFRALHLPETVDTAKIQSNYESGVLTIVLPKAEEKKKKQIKIEVGGSGQVIEAARK
jgi:HSP20 family protein